MDQRAKTAMTIKPMLGFVFLLALALGGCNWGKKAPECKVLVNSMSELGERLADARKKAIAEANALCAR